MDFINFIINFISVFTTTTPVNVVADRSNLDGTITVLFSAPTLTKADAYTALTKFAENSGFKVIHHAPFKDNHFDGKGFNCGNTQYYTLTVAA